MPGNSFIRWVKGRRSGSKNTRKYCDGCGGSVFRPCLEVLTIDLIHDWCQRGTVSRLVFLALDQWRALIVWSPWREKRLRWQEPIVTIYGSTSSTASLHNCTPALRLVAVTLVFQASCHVSQSVPPSNQPPPTPTPPSLPQPSIFFLSALKNSQIKRK